jgi:hypothetical protein
MRFIYVYPERALDVLLEPQREKLMMAANPTYSTMMLFLECIHLVWDH